MQRTASEDDLLIKIDKQIIEVPDSRNSVAIDLDFWHMPVVHAQTPAGEGIAVEIHGFVDTIDLCILSSVSDGVLYDLYSDKFISFSRFQETYSDTSGSAVEIQYRSFYIADHTHSLAEELLRSERIRLKK